MATVLAARMEPEYDDIRLRYLGHVSAVKQHALAAFKEQTDWLTLHLDGIRQRYPIAPQGKSKAKKKEQKAKKARKAKEVVQRQEDRSVALFTSPDPKADCRAQAGVQRPHQITSQTPSSSRRSQYRRRTAAQAHPARGGRPQCPVLGSPVRDRLAHKASLRSLIKVRCGREACHIASVTPSSPEPALCYIRAARLNVIPLSRGQGERADVAVERQVGSRTVDPRTHPFGPKQGPVPASFT